MQSKSIFLGKVTFVLNIFIDLEEYSRLSDLKTFYFEENVFRIVKFERHLLDVLYMRNVL